MSYASNQNLNQRLSYVEFELQNIPVPPFPTTSDLADVLLNGNSAGVTDIDMNLQDILQVNNIDLVTINGSVYPPAVSTLADVLLAGNSAGLTGIDMNDQTITDANLIEVISPGIDRKNTITNNGFEITKTSTGQPFVALETNYLTFYDEPTQQQLARYTTTLMEITNLAGTSGVSINNASATIYNPAGNDYSQLDINSLDFADASGTVTNSIGLNSMAITGAGTLSATGGFTIPSTVDFTNASAPTCVANPQNSLDLCNKNYVDSQSALTAYQLYFNYSIPYTVPGGATYKELSPLQVPTPATVAWTTNSTTPVLLGGFFNLLTGLNIPTSIPAGVWTLLIYANLTSSAGQAREGFFYEIYGTTALGAEVILYGSPASLLLNTVSPLIGSVSIQGTVPLISLIGYTGLGLKLYIKSNTNTNTTGSIFYQTPNAYSSVLTSFAVVQAPDLLSLNNTWTGTNNFTSTLLGNLTGTTTNLAGGLGGSIPYQSAVNTTALLPNGTAGQVLTSAGTTLAPTWTTGVGAINITDTNTNATYYPTFVDSAGTGKTLRADIGTGPFSINPNTGDLRFGTGLKLDASNVSVAVGPNAGLTTQGLGAIAIGNVAGQTTQGTNAVSIGNTSGNSNQGASAIGIGASAGQTTQGATAIAIGNIAGQTTQGVNAIAIGNNCANLNQGGSAIAIGPSAGQITQGVNSVSIGNLSGTTTQGSSSVAIGSVAGNNAQGGSSVAIGSSAGQTTQGISCVAIGNQAGQTTQSPSAIAIGNTAGRTTQGSNAVAIGISAGTTSQGSSAIAIGAQAGSGVVAGQGANAIAIGNKAGESSQTAGSICLNASGVALNPNQAGCFIDPIRNVTQTTAIGYDTTTKEMTYYTPSTTATNLAGGIASQIPYQSSAGTTAFIANGTVAQVLTSAGTSVPTWTTLPTTIATATNLAGGIASQIPYQSSAGTTAFIANGTVAQVLTSAGTSVPTWTTLPTTIATATNLAGGIASQIPYQTGAGTTAFIANGTASQVLTSAGTSVPTWTTLPTTIATATNLAGGIASQIPYQTGAGATSFIANGTSGQFLKSNGASVPTWASAPASSLSAVMAVGNSASTSLNMATFAITNAGAIGTTALTSSGNCSINGMMLGSGLVSGATSNTGFGVSVLSAITSGVANTSLGQQCLQSNTTGNSNTAVGFQTLLDNTTGTFNVAVGRNSGSGPSLPTLSYNTSIGYRALFRDPADTPLNPIASGFNTSLGSVAGKNTGTGGNNTYLGYSADQISATSNFSNSTAIGSNSKITASNQIQMGTATETVNVLGSISSASSIKFPSSAGSIIASITDVNAYTSTVKTVPFNTVALTGGQIAIGSLAGNDGLQGTHAIAIGASAGSTTQGAGSVAIGNTAGRTNQGMNSFAFGSGSAQTNQGARCIAMGNGAGNFGQGAQATALGYISGQTNQGADAIAIGASAGNFTQGANAVAIGSNAGKGTTGTDFQGTNAVAVGINAGTTTQGASAVAIGNGTGQTTQGGSAVAIGISSGQTTQGASAVAIGNQAGQTTQSGSAIAIGNTAGRTTQGSNAVAIGISAGTTSQGSSAIAIGAQAGSGAVSGQGANAIAIGNKAGESSQTAGSICLNASGVALNPAVAGLHIDPIRNVTTKQNQVQYNTTSKEVSYVAQVVSPITTSGLDLTGNVALLSGTSGSTSGQHLVIVVNGVTYKIKLENV